MEMYSKPFRKELHNKKPLKPLSRVKQLEGIISICMYCKKIRTDANSWDQLETYISNHSEALFSHGICPECYQQQMKELEDNRIKRPLTKTKQ
jgi:glucose-6-phosphate 1-dehydrogenase